VTAFPPGFFDRADPAPDSAFYAPARLVTHIDDGAIAAVGALYTELGLVGEVLDLMSSWISHFERPPRRLVGLGMNAAELRANPALAAHVVHDLNADPALPFPDACFDDATCCVSVDYLVEPVAVFAEVARVLRPGGRWVFSITHPIRWAFPDDPGPGGLQVTRSYFDQTPYVETGKDGSVAYAEHHRTLGERIRTLVGAGFTLLDLVEPEWPEELERPWGAWSPLRGRLIPGTTIFVCRLTAGTPESSAP